MEAGYGAEEQATRRSRRVERLRREREADASARSTVEAELERALKEQRAWSAGAEGERLVAATLETLAPYGWTALHDVHWPGRPIANIDHIAIGPGGVVVIDAKNWTGAVTLADGTLRQNGYRRDREVEGAAQAAAAVTALFQPHHRSGVRAAICLAGQEQAPAVCGPAVVVVGRLQLPSLLMSLPLRFSPYDVADIGRYLGQYLGGPTSPGVPPRARGTSTPPQRSRRRGSRPRGVPSKWAPSPPRSRTSSPPRSRSRRRSIKSELFRLAILVVGALIALSYLGNLGATTP